jgi:hypothetical protein
MCGIFGIGFVEKISPVLIYGPLADMKVFGDFMVRKAYTYLF